MTGVIYLVIIALWAAVLIPMWLRRHDQISEVRSTARFSTAMRSLANHDDDVIADDGAGDVRRPRPRSEVRPASAGGRAARDAATRRAIVLAALTIFLAGSLVGFLFGAVPVWLLVVAAVLLAGFVYASAATASQRSAGRARAVQRSERAVERRNVRPAPAARPERAVAEGRQAPVAAVEDDWETWNAWDDEDAWEAVPATLPTYVSAPRASAIPRPIDRVAEGEWNGQAMVQAAQAAQAMRRELEVEAFVDAAFVDAEDPDAMFDGRSGVSAAALDTDVTAEIPVIPFTDRRVVGA